MFKIVKLQILISIYELTKRSRRQDNHFISLYPSLLFDYQAFGINVVSQVVQSILPPQ